MDFELTNEHRLVEQSVREWAGREVAPRIRDLDRTHTFDRGDLSADQLAHATATNLDGEFATIVSTDETVRS